MRVISRQMGGLVSEEWPLWRALDVAGQSAQEWDLVGTFTPLTVNSSALCPYGSIQFTAGTGNYAVWTRPAWADVACIDIRWVDQGTNSAKWSYSFDGSTWVDNPVVSTAPANPRLMVTRIRCNNPTAFYIRAAEAGGTTRSFCLPYSPLTTWSSYPTFGTTGGLAMHNLGWDGQKLRAALNARTFSTGVSDGTTNFEDPTAAAFVANDVSSPIYIINPSTGAIIKTTVSARTDADTITLGTTVPAGTGVTYCIIQTNGLSDPLRLFEGDPGAIVPDLLVLGPWSNDQNTAGTLGDGDPNALKLMLQYVFDRITFCDILLVGCYEQGGGVSSAVQQSYRDMMATLADDNNVAYLDLYEAFAAWGISGYTAANAAGFMADTAHLTASGNRFVGAELARLLAVT
jgi:hypothetical protein